MQFNRMNEKRVMLFIFGLVILVALIGLVLFFKSAKTGDFSVRLPVNIKPSKTTRDIPAKALYATSRKVPEPPTLIKEDKPKAYDPCCLWMDQGMSFHISKASAKYMGFSRSKVGSSELFDKTDLVFVNKPKFYDSPPICVKGGTIQNPTAGEKLCVESYKGIPLPLDRKAGLLCVNKEWWLAGGICGSMDLEVPFEGPPMPD